MDAYFISMYRNEDVKIKEVRAVVQELDKDLRILYFKLCFAPDDSYDLRQIIGIPPAPIS